MYFITCFRFKEKPVKTEYPVISSRCFGYFPDFETADKAVKGNWGDMREANNDYAVIELIEPGIFSCAEQENRRFYQWNEQIGGFLPRDEFHELDYVSNFAIG